MTTCTYGVHEIYLSGFPLQEWRSPNQGRNNVAVRSNREGIYISHASRAFRDEEGKHFWVEMEIVDKYRVPSGFQGPYNVTVQLLISSFFLNLRPPGLLMVLVFCFYIYFFLLLNTDNTASSWKLPRRETYSGKSGL